MFSIEILFIKSLPIIFFSLTVSVWKIWNYPKIRNIFIWHNKNLFIKFIGSNWGGMRGAPSTNSASRWPGPALAQNCSTLQHNCGKFAIFPLHRSGVGSTFMLLEAIRLGQVQTSNVRAFLNFPVPLLTFDKKCVKPGTNFKVFAGKLIKLLLPFS